MPTSIIVVLVVMLLLVFSSACSTKDDTYSEYVSEMTQLIEYGDNYSENDMIYQAQYLYSFAGSSISALRFAIDNILISKNESQDLSNNLANEYNDWDSIAAVNYSSPYAYYFEGLLHFSEIVSEYGQGEAIDELLETIIGEVGKSIKTIYGDATIIATQYKKDQEKCKNRVDAVNKKRMVNDFYNRVNSKIDEIVNSKAKGWVLDIDNKGQRFVSFYEIPGNTETWTITMLLTKDDENDNKNPSGLYKGLINVRLNYDLSQFDQNYADKIKKSREMDTYVASATVTDNYQPTAIQRVYDCESFQLDIDVPIINSSSSAKTTKKDISSKMYGMVDDELKIVNIYHQLTLKLVKQYQDQEAAYEGVGDGEIYNPTPNTIDVPDGTEIMTISSYSAEDDTLQVDYSDSGGTTSRRDDFIYYFNWKDAVSDQEFCLEINTN